MSNATLVFEDDAPLLLLRAPAEKVRWVNSNQKLLVAVLLPGSFSRPRNRLDRYHPDSS